MSELDKTANYKFRALKVIGSSPIPTIIVLKFYSKTLHNFYNFIYGEIFPVFGNWVSLPWLSKINYIEKYNSAILKGSNPISPFSVGSPVAETLVFYIILTDNSAISNEQVGPIKRRFESYPTDLEESTQVAKGALKIYLEIDKSAN